MTEVESTRDVPASAGNAKSFLVAAVGDNAELQATSFLITGDNKPVEPVLVLCKRLDCADGSRYLAEQLGAFFATIENGSIQKAFEEILAFLFFNTGESNETGTRGEEVASQSEHGAKQNQTFTDIRSGMQ